jgi:hypothetical protein
MAAATDVTPSQLFEEQFQRLADFKPAPFYLNTQPDKHGHNRFETYLRHEIGVAGENVCGGVG